MHIPYYKSKDDMDLPPNVRMSLTLSPTNYKILAKWAKYHGKQPGEFASQIIASRLEANIELILRLKEVQDLLEDEPQVEDGAS